MKCSETDIELFTQYPCRIKHQDNVARTSEVTVFKYGLFEMAANVLTVTPILLITVTDTAELWCATYNLHAELFVLNQVLSNKIHF